MGDVCESGLQLLRHRLPEPGGQAAALQVLLQGFARVLVLPVAAQGQVEGRKRAAEVGERCPDGERQVLEVAAGGPGEVDPYGPDPSRGGPDGFPPLGRPVLGAGERRLELPGQGGLAHAADAVEDHDVVPRGLEVLDVEARTGDVLQMLGERGRDQLPLRLAVGEYRRRRYAPVVAAAQRPQIPSRHANPR
ncbi:hypothetical protein ABZ958_36370 [Streptomyces sp. NPDC046237]|uniref:hypothetical protein n=1 Tax=Streptomyces sp. NPDC046237 TaxID=3154914 RepID=UPI0033D764D3